MPKLLSLSRKLGISFSILLALIGGAWAQGIPISGQVISPQGITPNALVYICPSTALGTPCSPTATVYSSPTLNPLTQLTLPITTDQYGNYNVFAAAGYYIVQATVQTSPSTIIYSSIAGLSLTGSTAVFGNQPANTVLGNCTGSSAPPTFCLLTANMLPSTLNASTINGLTVNGAASVSTTLGVTGTSTLSIVNASGLVSANLGLTVTGGTASFAATTVSSTLGVTGLSSLGNLTVNGSQTLTALHGSVGSTLTTSAPGGWTNGHLLSANSTADIADSGLTSASFLNVIFKSGVPITHTGTTTTDTIWTTPVPALAANSHLKVRFGMFITAQGGSDALIVINLNASSVFSWVIPAAQVSNQMVVTVDITNSNSVSAQVNYIDIVTGNGTAGTGAVYLVNSSTSALALGSANTLTITATNGTSTDSQNFGWIEVEELP